MSDLQEIFEIVKDIAAILGAFSTIIAIIVTCTKFGKQKLHNLLTRNFKSIQVVNEEQTNDIKEIKQYVKKLDSRLEILERYNKQDCRDKLKNIYYQYAGIKQIPLYERKTADYVYDIYANQWNGNSYAKILYEEICKWEIINTGEISE